MKCESYRQFNNLFTRRLNKIFRNRAHRFALNMIVSNYQCDIEDGVEIKDTIFDRLYNHISHLGNADEQKACEELRQLMIDNPEYKERMHEINTRKIS